MLVQKSDWKKLTSFSQLPDCSSPYFCQNIYLNSFHQEGVWKKWVKFTFSSFWSCRAFKITHFRQKMCLSRFSPCGKTFVGKCCKKRPLSKSYLPTKAKSFQSFLNSSIILKKFLCLLIQRFWGNQYLKVLMASKCDEEKNSFTNQVVKDKIVFPLFFCQI